jgi:drug/metabolite transporter (DMT)-like permease
MESEERSGKDSVLLILSIIRLNSRSVSRSFLFALFLTLKGDLCGLMNNKLTSWGLFILICCIWGSSFILMKWGLYDSRWNPILSPYQVAAIRILSAGIVMFPFLRPALKNIPRDLVLYVLLSGWLGSFFPAFLFCIAETKVDSAFAGTLNAITPLFVIITGAVFFNLRTTTIKVIGVLVGLGGSAVLVYANSSRPLGEIAYAGFVLLATFFYGCNVNMISKKLAGISSMHIAAIAFTGLIPPSLVILISTGYFNLPLATHGYVISTIASCILGIIGTAIASVLFYVLVKKSGGLFASLVTYGIPFIAIGWGIYYGEKITSLHVVGLAIILAGVYVANLAGGPGKNKNSS